MYFNIKSRLILKLVFPIFLFLVFINLANIVSAEDLGPPPAGIEQIEELFSRILRISVGLAFIALVFVLVLAGYKYLTSNGDAKNIQQASSTLSWAGIGIVMLAVAWVVLLIVEQFTGVKVTVFCLNPLGCN
jgi:hypothetical protein